MTNASNISTKDTGICADAVALQERDEFRADGWTRVLSPAKVNLHLAIGQQRPDGYHDAATVMHALSLHDVLYLRPSVTPQQDEGPQVRMIAAGDVVPPQLESRDNLAARAVVQLAEALGLPKSATNVEIRIEKNIPAQAGLGGGSGNAAAALVGAAALWQVEATNPAIEGVARALGADVAFFLRGGCSYYEGVGDEFIHTLQPSKQAVALVKPEGGVSTAQAYQRFDAQPCYATDQQAAAVREARAANDVALFNNLAPASEAIMPQLAQVHTWLGQQEGVQDALLCGSGACTFARCHSFAAACAVVAAARKQGWWARATSFSGLRAAVVRGGGV